MSEAILSGCLCCQCVRTTEVGIVERFGQFQKSASAGCVCVAWPIDVLVSRLSLRTHQLDVNCETKTKDNVFVTLVISVQYKIMPGKAYEAHYKLTNPTSQITSYVYDVIRSTIPKMNLDETFTAKDDITHRVIEELQATMTEFGYEIHRALVTDLSPSVMVKTAMNEINAQKRLRAAAQEKAEGDKIIQVKAAEADAESKYLSGLGVARQRQAIVNGLRDSINEFSDGIEGTSPKDVMDLLLLTQYFDMIKDVGASPGSAKTLFIPHGPQSVNELQANLRSGLMHGLGNTKGPVGPSSDKITR